MSEQPSSAVTLPTVVDNEFCIRQAARLLLESESPLMDSDNRASVREAAELWVRVAESVR